MHASARSIIRPLAAASLGLLCGIGQVWGYTATPIDGTTVTAQTLAQSLLSANSGIAINSVSYAGADSASGLFSSGNAIFGIDSGIVLTSGSATAFGDNALGVPGAPILKPLTTGSTNDASVLTIRFTPQGEQIQFSYVFGSREYPEYVDSEYNDAFGMFVNGQNYALITDTAIPVAINNINCGNSSGAGTQPFCSLFVDNRAGDRGISDEALGGWTRVLTFTAPVNAGVENELIIAIADVGDEGLDSAALIAGGTLAVCGSPGQPVCGGDTGTPSAAVGLPLMSPTQSGLMALLLAALAGWQLRRRRAR